jgi:RimJ/RimL family protein N-acetyltransferase
MRVVAARFLVRDAGAVAHLWPFFDLVVTTPTLTLRIPTDEQLVQLTDVIRDGIHAPEWMPFDDPPWTDEPTPERERSWLVRQWAARTTLRPDQWRLRFAVFDARGEPLGMQDMFATTFPALRTVGTYSWLGRLHQGRGIGKEMRSAVLHLAFSCFGAARAESSAFEDNLGSAGVSRSLGYMENGFEWGLRRGQPERLTRFVLSEEDWRRTARGDITTEGVEPCAVVLGLSHNAG